MGAKLSSTTLVIMVVAPCHIMMCPISSIHCSHSAFYLSSHFISLPHFSVSPQIIWTIMNYVKVTRFSFCSYSLKHRESRNASASLGIDFFQKIDLLRVILEQVRSHMASNHCVYIIAEVFENI